MVDWQILDGVQTHGFDRNNGIIHMLVIILDTITFCVVVPRLLQPSKLISASLHYRAAIGVISMGILAQIFLSVGILTNYRWPDSFASLWALKDFGFAILILSTSIVYTSTNYRPPKASIFDDVDPKGSTKNNIEE